jgi:hypothetical protein
MKNIIDPGVFKPKPSRFEVKSDATSRVARDITYGEASARVAKTERLRAARMAQEILAQETTAPEPPAKKKLSKR